MITPGLTLSEHGTPLPESVALGTESYPFGWVSVQDKDRDHLKEQLRTAGWIFYYLAGAVKATAFGVNREKLVDEALMRIIAKVRLQKCNCVEIDEVKTRSFLGFPYVTISAHARHIEKAPAVSWPMALPINPLSHASSNGTTAEASQDAKAASMRTV